MNFKQKSNCVSSNNVISFIAGYNLIPLPIQDKLFN